MRQGETAEPHLRRELNLYDLTLLLVIAVVNINTIPLIASAGWPAISFWLVAFLLFLIPQALSVAEFSAILPGEGGIYVWTREMFGDFHAFISGWCYWTNNLFYFPSVLFILLGILAYTGGDTQAPLASNNYYIGLGSVAFLWFITLLHIRGLGIGKWLNNFGAIGTWLGLLILIVIGVIIVKQKGASATPFTPGSLLPSFRNYGAFSTFSIAMYSLVGLELGSVMGDEIKNARGIVGRAALIAGAISIVLYVLGTTSLLIAVSASQIGAVQGLMQAVSILSMNIGALFLIPVISVLLALAVLGVCSAWIAGAARIPFVMGLGVYLPPSLGRTHPQWGTPYIALIVQAILSTIFISLSLIGTYVTEAYQILLSSSVIIQLIPFLYLFLGLWKLKKKRIFALLGTISTAFGIAFVFVSAAAGEHALRFEFQIIASTFVMLGSAVAFYVIGKRKQAALLRIKS